MKYTKQDKLGRFGKRWGCLATCLINIVETELNRTLLPFERKACIGAWFMSGNILLANYKHHEMIALEPGGWDSYADPEWHFLVFNKDGDKDQGRFDALHDIMDAFGIKTLLHRYAITELSTGFGFHYLLEVDGLITVNPDPSVKGDIIDSKPIG